MQILDDPRTLKKFEQFINKKFFLFYWRILIFNFHIYLVWETYKNVYSVLHTVHIYNHIKICFLFNSTSCLLVKGLE